MAKILVHALAATAGGGATYLRHFLAHLPEHGDGHEWLVLAPEGFDPPPPGENVRMLYGERGGNAARRLYIDQVWMRQLVRREQVDLVLATGNFGLLHPPAPQVLLNRNALYFSRDHLSVLWQRRDLKEMLNIVLRQRMALASIRASAANVVPTAAFGDEIREWLPSLPPDRLRTVPHGFDRERFLRPEARLHESLAAQLNPRVGVRRILMVSHYNYFRNFETLLRAFARLKQSYPEPLELVLTTKLGFGVHDHRYDTTRAACLLEEHKLGGSVAMLGTVPHHELHPLYRACDVVVCPSYAESFGHPMVEAMASGRPVVASDRGVHREVCGDAAVYFPTFDADGLAQALRRVLDDGGLARRLGENGVVRSRAFTWPNHFRGLLAVLDEALGSAAKETAA